VDQLAQQLTEIVGKDAVLSEEDELLVYECDGLPQHKFRPRAVVFPSSTEMTAAVMRLLSQQRVPFTPRGAGTGLSGGALTLTGGVVIELARMRNILKIDSENRLAVVQPGVVNAHVSRAAAPFGLHYVPDPSSNSTCTIGGNIAENAGGIHCLKYGTTTDHVLAVRAVLSNGDVVEFGSNGNEQPGYDLLGTFVGSEGTFGITTEATLRLVPIPAAIRTLLADFLDVNDASHAVSAIIAAGVMPAALEMMDHAIIEAVEASVFAAGLPRDAGAALLIELDGLTAGIDDEAERVKGICLSAGARTCRLAVDENERKKLWAARKGAFGAIGRIAPDSMIQDAVVPRSRLPEVLADVYRIASKYHLRIANVFHAGDGNLHPLICFDRRSPAEVEHVKDAGRELMETCVAAGGSISGEHGVGYDKRELLPLIFSDADMSTMLKVRSAFDPQGLMNPGKIIPTPRGCGEARAVANVPANGNGGPAKVFEPAAVIEYEAPNRPDDTPIRVAPASTQEASTVLRQASEKNQSVDLVGGNTWPNIGNGTKTADITLQSTFWNRIIEHEPADLIATAEAGVTLADFNSALKARGQWLPLDPPDDGRATIGGVVATGLGGAQRTGYGTARNFVIGMKVVLADGTLIKAGGRVVKNVAGYDLCKLFTGSYGTLGLITEVTFKLRPVPQLSQTVVALGQAEDLLAGARSIISNNLLPVAIEMLSPSLAAAAEFSDDKNCLLLVRFSGLARAVPQQMSDAIKLLTAHSRDVGPLETDDDSVWQKIAALPLQLSGRCAVRASVSPAMLPELLRLLSASKMSSMWQASLAAGGMRLLLDNTQASEELLANVTQLRNAVEAMGGSLIIEKIPDEIRDRIDAWGTLGSRRELMSRIKQQLDPQNILSPGRYQFASE